MPSRADPSPSFRFRVVIQGITVAQFSECSGLDFEQETFPYREGGLQSTTHQLPGRWKYTNLTLKRGIATDGNSLWAWVKDTVQGKTVKPHDVQVELFDLEGKSPLRTWNFSRAFPVHWTATALSADQNAIAIESLVLAHQGLVF
ncbi:MAG: phage tail protein [Anaerolineae bacterium]